MLRRSLRAVDDDGNAVVLFENVESQTVETSAGPIVYRQRPHIEGPDGEQLVEDGPNAFRSPKGKRFVLTDAPTRKS